MIQPSGSDYYATTDIVRNGSLSWGWAANLRQPWPALDGVLDTASGWCWTKKRAERKADRAARRMMRAADSWARRTYKPDGTVEAS